MKLRPLCLLVLLTSSLLTAKYDRVGNSIHVYGIKDYGAAFLEGFMGSVGLFWSTVFFADMHNRGGIGVSTTAKLVAGLGALGSGAVIADAVRRAFANADVMLDISYEGLQCKDAGMVLWKDVKRIEGVSYTTIQFGRPSNSGYRINIDTNENAVPIEIDGSKLSESLNTVLSFMRKFYKGKIDIKRETVQDLTPRPTNVNVHGGGGGRNDDALVNLVQLGVDMWGNNRRR